MAGSGGALRFVTDARVVARVVATGCALIAGLMVAGGGVPSTFGWATVPLLAVGAVGMFEWARHPTPRWLTVGAPAVVATGFLSRVISVALTVAHDDWARIRLSQAVAAIAWLLGTYLWVVVWRQVLLPFSVENGRHNDG